MARSLILLIMVIGVSAAQKPLVLHGQSLAVLIAVVRAEDSGRLLPGARLVVSRDGATVAQAVSDRDGRVEVVVPEDGRVELVITKAGFAPARMANSVDTLRTLDIRLTPGAVITGRVVDAAGLPTPEFAVQVRRAGGTDVPPGPWITTLTNDLGEYRVGSLPAGMYEVGPGNAASVLLGAALPEQMQRAAPPGARVELHAGKETAHDVTRPPAPAPTAASTAAVRKAFEGMRQAFGGPPVKTVDPATAAQISGTVTSDGVNSDAIVHLIPQDGSAPLTTLTFPQGRYEFDAVQPGAYRVLAQGRGMVTGEHGATASNRTGTWLVVRARQRLERIDVVVPRAAVIAGRVLDVYGEPLEGLKVEAWQARIYDGRPVLTPAIEASSPAASTDDRGQYRLSGLTPGRYYVVASEPEPAATPPGTPSDMVQFAVSQTLGRLATPGRPHTYYPGRPTAQEASPIVVDVGDYALGLDMLFVPAFGVPVSGVVLGPTGIPLRAQLTLSVSRRSGAPAVPPYRAATRLDGTFAFPYVVPGEYVLHAEEQGSGPGGLLNTLLTVGSAFGDGATGVSVTGAGETTNPLLDTMTWTADSVPAFGSTFVPVTGPATPPIVVQTSTGSTLTGRLTFEGPQRPSSPTDFAVGFAPADTDLARAFVPAARGTEDGRLEAAGLVGPTRVMATRTPEGWWLKSAIVDGVNAVEQPVTFAPSSASAHVDVVFSSAPSGVRGRVLDRAGAPMRAATVLVFPADWRRWHAGTRYVRQAPASDGQFEVSALPPARYHIIAVDTVAAITIENWQEPDLLERLSPLAQSLTVREDRVANVQLTVVEVTR